MGVVFGGAFSWEVNAYVCFVCGLRFGGLCQFKALLSCLRFYCLLLGINEVVCVVGGVSRCIWVWVFFFFLRCGWYI